MFPAIRKKINKYIGISTIYFGISIDQLTPNSLDHIVEFNYKIRVKSNTGMFPGLRGNGSKTLL